MSDASFLTVERAGPGASARRAIRTGALVAADVAAATLAIALLAALLRSAGLGPGAGSPGDWLMLALAWGALLVSLHKAMGFYAVGRRGPIEQFRDHVLACALLSSMAAFALAAHLAAPALLASWLLVFGLMTVLGLLARGLVQEALIRLDLWREPVALVGPAGAVGPLAARLEAEPRLGLRPALQVAMDAAPSIGAALGEGFAELARAGEPVACVILLSTGDGERDWRIAADLPVPSVLVLRDAGSLQTLWMQPRAVGSAVGFELRHGLLLPGNLRLKRVFDLALALPLLCLAAPLVLLAALAIMAVDPGNPFYAQPRQGHRGRTIRVLKLRSMYRDAEARLERHLAENPEAAAQWARSFKLRSDPRILPLVGSLLRRSSIDELPQLLNVVRGDMSLVGPRPFPFYHLEAFEAGFRDLRASVMPGLSGYWQISARSDSDLEAQRRLDVFYIRNWSVWLDLYILVHTLPAVLLARGAR